MNNTLLFYPVSIVHDRNIKIFELFLPEYKRKYIYEPDNPNFSGKKHNPDVFYFFKNGIAPEIVFKNTDAIILFSAQARVTHADLITEACLKKIPVIALQEVFQMMLEQGFVNEYFLPVDHLFVGSNYEKEGFLNFGLPNDAVEAKGSIFRYKCGVPTVNTNIKKTMRLPGNKKYALLSLAYLTPSGETLEIRRQLIKSVYNNLPNDYSLIVKPHPAEEYKKIEKFVKDIAPEAKVADKITPIDDILQITDILFNRGNSQVVIDALERNIPVIVIPCGRRTFFHGLLDEVIIKDASEIPNVIKLVNEKGMALYKPVFEKYLAISGEEAVNNVLLRIKQIVEGKLLCKPEERLLDIVLYWCFMGYASKAKKVLNQLKKISNHNGNLMAEKASKLIAADFNKEDILFLRKQAGSGYRKWLIQSLFIRSQYLRKLKLNADDAEWLKDFPSRMNREYFINYSVMLGWLYFNSGMIEEAKSLTAVICPEYNFLKNVNRLNKVISSPNNTVRTVKECCRSRFSYLLNSALREMALKFNI
jgi:hypothetical protein